VHSLRHIYDMQDAKYPTLHPDFLCAYADFVKKNGASFHMALFWRGQSLIGYVPFEMKNIFILKRLVVSLPIQMQSHESYIDLLELFIQTSSNWRTRIVFRTHPRDIFQTVSTDLLIKKHAIIVPFVTHIVENADRLGKTTRQVLQKIEKKYTVNTTFNRELFDTYFSACFVESRKRKTVHEGNAEREYYFTFYSSLIHSGLGMLVTIQNKEGQIVSGYFVVKDAGICIHLHGATSNEGVRNHAGYANCKALIDWCVEHGYIFDLFGAFKNMRADVYGDNTYSFKRKWGKEISIPQYILEPGYLRMIEKVVVPLFVGYKKLFRYLRRI
jgi:hypothetical protein